VYVCVCARTRARTRVGVRWWCQTGEQDWQSDRGTRLSSHVSRETPVPLIAAPVRLPEIARLVPASVSDCSIACNVRARGERKREREVERERENVCVCVRERERESVRDSVHVCVCVVYVVLEAKIKSSN